MLTTLSTEDLIPPDHPIRRIRVIVDAVLAELDDVFDQMYATSGRSSVPPESLLKATILMAMYSIRSERAFCERLNYDLLFKWFLELRIDQPAFDASTFSKNRQRLLDHDVADEFFAAVVRQAKLRRYISSDHFTVDGTLLEAWASHKSFKPKDGPPSEPPVGGGVVDGDGGGVVGVGADRGPDGDRRADPFLELTARDAELTTDPLHRHPRCTVGRQELMGELVGGRARDPRYRCSFHDRQQIRNPDLNSQIAHRRSFTYRRAYEAGDRYNDAPPLTAIDDPKRGICCASGRGSLPLMHASGRSIS